MTTETNEERLEKIKIAATFGKHVANIPILPVESLGILINKNDFKWLIEQAEQLNDIENRSVLNSLKECSGENACLLRAHELKDMEHGGLIQQLKEKDSKINRLRETLEFYADMKKYDRDVYNESIMDDDNGFRARQALAGDPDD